MEPYSWEDDEQQAAVSDPDFDSSLSKLNAATGGATPGVGQVSTQPAGSGLEKLQAAIGGQTGVGQSVGGGVNTGVAGGVDRGTPTEIEGGLSSLTGVGGGSDFGLGTSLGGETPTSRQAQIGAKTSAPSTATNGAASAGMEALSQKAQSLSSIADPSERARVQDEISRSVATTLQGAGHTVKWQGDTLMVDGRPYVVGSAGQQAAAPGSADAAAGTATGAASQPATAQGASSVDPNKSYDPNDALNQANNAMQARFKRNLTPEEQQALINAIGYTGGPMPGAMLQQALDYIGKYSGNLADPWGTPGGGGGGGNGGGGNGTPGSGTPDWRASWSYTPGQITTNDLDGFDAQTVMSLLGPALQSGTMPNDPATQQLISSLLANPESMGPGVVDALKARSKDELAEMGQMESDQLRNYGFDTGITDSNWLKSEQLAATRDRQNALVSKNRDIDIDAAKTNFADRQAVGKLGMQFSDQRFGQALASKQEQRQAVQLAQDTGLRSAAIRGDRMALREQINAKAAELGLDADKVALQYTLGLMDDLTKRYNIDVGKDIDLKKLASADRQFVDELAFKYAQLQFQYDELAKRDDWAQLDAGVRLATAGYSGEGGSEKDAYDRNGWPWPPE
ncbi:MAG: hypothetical protein IT181_13220 [Acidobacteria bacterium]|nr:hypothetical protein [Acidobacteriota bacterium]